MGRFNEFCCGALCTVAVTFSAMSGVNGQDIQIGTGCIFSGNSGSVVIKGNLINNGTFINQNNTVLLNGALQTISGDSTPVFHNLTLSGTGQKNISSGASVTVNSSLVTGDLLVVESSGPLSSGSLIVKGTTSGTFTYKRQLYLEANYGDYQFISSPVAGNTETNTGKITDVYSWDEVGGKWPFASITSLVSGVGYNIDQTSSSDGLISFTGTMATSAVINGTSPYGDVVTGGEANYYDRTFTDASGHSGVARGLTNYGGGGWNLLGNPFPSAISATAFIDANFSTTPALNNIDPNYVALYLYDGTVGPHGKYYYVSISTGWWGEVLSQMHIQAGQGFFVMAMNDLSVFHFDRSMQEHAPQDKMYKSAKKEGRWPGLLLKVKHENFINSTLILYHDGMTGNIDPGYDIGLMGTNPEVEIYTTLPVSNGVRYVQHALPVEGCDTIVLPVGIDFIPGGEVTFSAVTEPLPDYDYVLEDRVKSVFTNLSTDSYTVTLPAGTKGTGRFFIHAKASTTTDVSPDPSGDDQTSLRVWASDKTVYISGYVNRKSMAYIYDLRAKTVYEGYLNEGTYNSVPLPGISEGIYVVRISDGQQTTTKKILIL